MTKKLTTPRGAVLEIELTKLDDMRLFDALVALQDGDPLQMPRIMNLILTPEQKAAVYEACRDENGRIPIEAVNDEILAIFNAFNESKKLLILAAMAARDEDALVCDMAETYHIFDYRALPLFLAARLACGLREDSRSKCGSPETGSS